MTYKSKKRKKTSGGFTLVEITIVTIVVSFLVVGLRYGLRFYHESQIRSVYATVTTVKRSYNEFKAKYGSQPGDMSDAQTKLFDCNDSPANSCRNGTLNDNFIGRPDKKITNSFNTIEDIENGLFWYHLQQAGFISGVQPKVALSADTAKWSIASPAVSAGGGLAVRAINIDVCYGPGQPADMVGVWLIWKRVLLDAPNASLVVSPKDAYQLDKKYDDGRPGGGEIRAGGNNEDPAAVNGGCRNSIDNYADSTEAKCYMYFRISRDVN